MRYLVTDASGTILRTITTNSSAEGLAQLGASETLYQAADDIGFIDDSRLMVSANALTLKDPTKPAAYSGTALTAVNA